MCIMIFFVTPFAFIFTFTVLSEGTKLKDRTIIIISIMSAIFVAVEFIYERC